MTDLRELVDMLPGEMRDDALGDYGVTDDDECYYSLGGGFYEPADETKVRREVLGYLVEWLGERGAHIRPCYGGWEFVNDKVQWGTYPTPLEAAVRAVVQITDTTSRDTHTTRPCKTDTTPADTNRNL